jgi:two-component system, cell cycle sensor histidine kinase and response regulator CckA
MREDLEEIKRAGERARDLTHQLLAFSRQQVIAPRVLDLDTILSGMERMLQRLLGEDIALQLHASPKKSYVEADPGQIEQIVMNLAVNARDAMPSGGNLTIETAEVDLDGNYAAEHLGVKPGLHVMLAVTDTGVGMDKATQRRIFEPFFTTKPTGQGTGLGLATVFGIVQQSGGTIWVYSEPRQGTTFKIYLPRSSASPVESVSRSARPVALRGVETILLVEDEDQVRHLVRNVLQRSGYEVLEAHNPGDALLLCEQHPAPIDLLLTDVVMPRMSGPELCERLSAVRTDLKVLFISGYTERALPPHRLRDPDLAFLQKPISPDSLLRKVREVLDRIG